MAAPGNPFQFTGLYFDYEIDQHYARARQFSTELSRFTSRDPVVGNFNEPLTLHAYLYCLNDPINRTDLSGEYSVAEETTTTGIQGGMGSSGGNATQITFNWARQAISKIQRQFYQRAMQIYRNGGKFTRHNFRRNLMDLLGELGENCDAHHVFAQKFANAFFDAGIDIHNPLFGAFIEMHQHRKDVSGYQKEWKKFFDTIKYHYCPDVASLMVVNIVQNKELYPKQVLFDLNSDSLYNPLLKRGSNEFWPNGILANNGLFALVAVSLDSKAVPWQSQS